MDLNTVIADIGGILGEHGMSAFPSEFALGGVFVPPLMVAGTFGVATATLTAILLNRLRLARFFFYPPLVYVALVVIYTGLISRLFLPV